MATMKLVTGLVKTRGEADVAVRRIFELGHGPKDVSVVMSDQTHQQQFAIEESNQAAAGAGIGSIVGGAVGAVLAALVVGASIAIPGFGLVVAGPLAAALVGAGAGSAAGGLIGALAGAGIPEYRARAYEPALKQGGIVIAVHARDGDDARKVEKVLDDVDAEEVHVQREASSSA